MKGGELEEDHVFMEWNAQVHPRPVEKYPKEHPLGSQEEIHAAVNTNWRAVVSPDGWKLALYDKDNNELYNLNEDPGETTNMYRDPACRQVVTRLTARIRAWQRITGDTLMPVPADA
jgi:hypothetical protein